MWPAQLRLLDHTAKTPAENLAIDEALLQAVDGDPTRACLRLWELDSPAVIVGRSNRIEREADVEACQREHVPIYRRCSGGGAVVIGPGCLCFSLVLPISEEIRARGVTIVTAAILNRLQLGFVTAGHDVAVQGISDLTHAGRKFSGNSQRWLRRALLHHGTILYAGDLPQIQRLLQFPSLQPEYRASRPHDAFITNLALPRTSISSVITATWNATPDQLTADDLAAVPRLLMERYSNPAWHHPR